MIRASKLIPIVDDNRQVQGISVTVYDNLVDVTNQATITISITDKDSNVIGSKISDINFDEAGEYTISYKIKYRKFNKTLTRTIIIQ
jgi:hypothetical protein